MGWQMQKLPVFGTFGNMLDSVIENISTAFQVSWPWLLVLFPIRLAGDIIHFWYGKLEWARYSLNNKEYDGIEIVVTILTAIAFASIAVNWHRFILRSEIAEGGQRLRLDGLVWRYFFFGIAIFALVTLVALGVGLALLLVGWALSTVSTAISILFGVVVGIPLILLLFGLTFRWSVKLVAIALGDTEFTLGDAWRSTTGNTWRLTGLYLLFVLAISLIGSVDLGSAYAASLFNSSIVTAIVAGVSILVGWFSTLMAITMLTSLYSFFVEKRTA